MSPLSISRDLLVARLAEIRAALARLEQFDRVPLEEFRQGDHFAVAEHHLRRALEAVFDAGAHLVSRLGGARVDTYKEIARRLGETGLMSADFANGELTQMAGYRNRLIHFYHEVAVDELYEIVRHHRQDLERFARCVEEILKAPERFGLTF